MSRQKLSNYALHLMAMSTRSPNQSKAVISKKKTFADEANQLGAAECSGLVSIWDN
jgi:hypothetical protein